MKPSLVVLAAGLGSRYGGIKQLDGFGPNGERIIDYTIYDAIKVGFGKIIFVIREQIASEFKEAILDKWKDQVDFRIVFQELNSLPVGYELPAGRVKPWGTAHAVWMAENEVNEPFAIVNADDFYGRNSLGALAMHLSSLDDKKLLGCLVGYELARTVTENGSVSRGICTLDNRQSLTSVVERTHIVRNTDEKIYFDENGVQTFLPNETIVSMNLMGFTSQIFSEIAKGFEETYLAGKTDLKAEYYIPKVLSRLIAKGIQVPVLPTIDNWFGVTYTEDKAWVKKQLLQLVRQDQYPSNLFPG
ncbi:MAG: nucleotidyltransferase [Flammeovirgaceae bacterium]|jgi:NDP-sugar pyrophosphorylase family protein|nr:nucleotidyltransferase [Flammeovirgaceae bacterium]|tara:strand:+ start:20450 stop:21355 length:906 start_codon:yes stop_codon:yes gene_type:complete